jgi:hypothetical protein
MLDHAITLLGIGDDFDNLSDAVVGREVHGTDVDLDPVLLVVCSELSHFLWPSGRPHARLAVRANLADNLSYLWLETHVKHTVSLVKDKVCHAAQVGLAGLKHVNQTTRSRNAHFDATGKITDLLTTRNTTIDASITNARGFSEFGHFLLDLHGELTSRRENEDDRAITWGEKRLSVDVHNGRQAVGQSLSRSSFGNTDNITSRQCHRPALGLDGRWFRESLSRYLAEDIIWEAGLFKSLDGLRDAFALDGDLVNASEGLDFGVGAVGDGIGLFIEALLELGERSEI